MLQDGGVREVKSGLSVDLLRPKLNGRGGNMD